MRARNFEYAGFNFSLTFENEWDDKSVKKYRLKMMEMKKSDVIGNVDGYLIDRKVGGFFERCDAISSELQVAGCLCCDNKGKIRPSLSKIIVDEKRVACASRGGFLYINEVMLSNKAKRGCDLGLVMLQALFHNLDKSFSLAVLYPAPWDTEDRRRDEPDSQRGSKIIKIARHFARVGFAPIMKSGYMFVENCQIPQNILPKETTSQLAIPLEPAPRNLSELDEELIKSLDDLAKVKNLISQGADPKNSDALHHACARQLPLPVLQLLLANGCGVDDLDAFGQSPLMLAASLGRANAVCHLIALGADPALADEDGHTALDAFHTKQQSLADLRETFDLDSLAPTPAMLATRAEERAKNERILAALSGPKGAPGKRKRAA
jgi:hypothetical protein